LTKRREGKDQQTKVYRKGERRQKKKKEKSNHFLDSLRTRASTDARERRSVSIKRPRRGQGELEWRNGSGAEGNWNRFAILAKQKAARGTKQSDPLTGKGPGSKRVRRWR